MKEETYVKLLDTFTWTVVAMLTLYIVFWIIENYNTGSINLNEEQKDDIDIIDSVPEKAEESAEPAKKEAKK